MSLLKGSIAVILLLNTILISVCHMPLRTVRNADNNEKGPDNCANVSKELIAEIQSYRPVVKRIGELIINGTFKGRVYNNLTDFVDNYGARLTGSEALEKAIDNVLERMKNSGLQNVHSEDVSAPKWVRGFESLVMTEPYKKEMQVFGMLPTVQTPEEGITSEIVVVESYEELYANTNNVLERVKGKILVFNHPFDDPVNAVRYRHRAAIEGSKVGASAVVVRSYTTFSLGTPHTGEMHYESNVAPIPSAEITVEDAALLGRLAAKGQKIVLTLTLRNERKGNITTRNSIGDYVGASIPDEYVLVSGHVDSWDIGQGALDDGFGVMLSLMVPEVLQSLQLKPKRTVRTIIWTAEESGEIPIGAQQYAEKHYAELQNYTMFLEPDSGFFDVKGFIFNGSSEAICIVTEVLRLLEPDIIDKTVLSAPFPELKTDIVQLMKASGVPGALLATDFDKYFWYHHSQADTVESLNSTDLDVCLTLLTSVSYVLADLSIKLPRDECFL